VRACLDSLTDAGVYDDDRRVAELGASKRYVGAPGCLSEPGVIVEVRRLNGLA
jgi:Holliday junction resolvase RusA-like endonuclease